MITLNYKVFGEGDPVIILHGIFGMLDNWQSFGKKLAKNYTVYLVDQRDHGRSPHTEEFSYELLAEDLKNFIDEHQLVKPRLIGHSMGGKTVMEYLLRYSGSVSQSVVVDMGIKNYTGGHEYLMEALASIPLDQVQSRKEAQDILSKEIDNQSVMLFLMKNFTRKKGGGYRWKINLPLLRSSYRDLMDHDLGGREEVDDQVLLVRGGNSNYVLDEDLPSIQEVLTESKLETIENAGHWVHAERPEELLEVISDFFRQESS